MKVCPNCKNDGWTPVAGRKEPLENIGGKETFTDTTVRRYLCHNCGLAHYAYETWGEQIDIRGARTLEKLRETDPDLFSQVALDSVRPVENRRLEGDE